MFNKLNKTTIIYCSIYFICIIYRIVAIQISYFVVITNRQHDNIDNLYEECNEMFLVSAVYA